MVRRLVGLAMGLVALGGAGGAAAVVPGAAAAAAVAPVPTARLISHVSFVTPPTTADCEQQLGIACYAPFQFQRAYNLGPLYKHGLNGRGQTIVIVDSFGYQHIRGELRTFDKSFRLPAPPSFRIIHPAGPIPPYDPNARPSMFGWAIETSLDVEYAHAIAPGANILLVETPVPETLGVQGFPQIVRAENFVIDHHMGNVITQSFAAPEATFPSARSILRLRGAYRNAVRHGVSVLAASGDAGATGPNSLDAQGFPATFFLHRAVNWPASDPLVTGIGGTQLHLDAKGNHVSPDTVWNDTALEQSPAATGGGRSQVFSEPVFQHGIGGLAGRRGVPDISMSAAVDGSALVFLDAKIGAGPAGFFLVGGTSEASPEFAGIVSIADQWAGHGLGLLNPAIYRLERRGAGGIVDVTSGTNTVTFPQGGSNHTVVGFDAGPGYDMSTGVGTLNAARFVPELVAASGG
jgi:subtilase family serine protease